MESKNKTQSYKAIINKRKFYNLKNIIAITAILVFSSFLYIKTVVGSLTHNLVDSSTDDTLITHAVSWATPEYFVNDFRSANFSTESSTSLLNFIPSMALKFLGIDPLNFYVFFLILQILLMPVSVFYLAKVFKVSTQGSIILTLAFLIIRPQYWNLAWVGDLDWMPYATWIALPFFLLYFAFKLESKSRNSYLSLLFGVAFHPTFGVLILMFDVFWEYLILKNKFFSKESIIKSKHRNSSYLFTGLWLLYNFLYIRSQAGQPVPKDYVNAILGNNHFRAILATPGEITWRTTFTSILFITALMCIIVMNLEFEMVKKHNYRLVPAITIFLIAASIAQIVALKLSNLTLTRIMFTRFSIFATVILFIYAFAILFRKKLRPDEIFGISIFLLFPGVFSLIVLIFVLFASKLHKSISYLLYLTASIALLVLSRISFFEAQIISYFSPNYKQLGLINLMRSNSPYGNLLTDRFSVQLLEIVLLLLTIYIFFVITIEDKKYSKNISIQGVITVITLFLGLIFGRDLEASIRHDPRIESLVAVQRWAKSETRPGTVFMGENWSRYLGWRTYSRRGMVYITDCGSSAYFYSKSDARCWKLQDEITSSQPTKIEEIKMVSKVTSAKYLLSSKDQELPFRKIYINNHYIIYDTDMYEEKK